MELNENAGLDTSQVEDLRGSRGGGLFPSGGGRGGMMIPGLRGGKGGAGILGLLVVGLIACLCLGGGKLGGLGSFGDLGGLGSAGGNNSATVDNSDIQESCAVSNPDRFQNESCRNLLYINSI